MSPESLSEAFGECDICFALIQLSSIENHRYWHRVSGSPMALGLYLAQFSLLNKETS